MDYKRLSLGLGFFSIALGAIELLAPGRIARTLDAPGADGLVRGFGAREVMAGAALLGAPAAATNVWNRVAGDAMDLAALGVAARRSPGNRAVWGAIAFVVGATVLDIVTARGLDRTTGKTLPDDAGRARRDDALRPATSIEPEGSARGQALALA